MLFLLPQMVASGLMLGFVYALVAVGLSLIWGVMDIINFAYGEFLMLGMYSTFWFFTLFRMDPLLSLPIQAMVVFMIGFLVYKLLIKRVVDVPGLSALLATFGLRIFFRNLAQFLWTPNYRFINESFVADKRVFLFDGALILGMPQLVAGIGSILMTLAVFYFVQRTRMGRAIQATSMDKEAARLMGIDTEKVYSFTFGLAGACVGVAAALLASFYPIYPESGSIFGLIALVIVALGGFGNIRGALYSGVIIGLTESIGGFFLGAEFKYALIFLIYLIVMQVRPKGLFGW
ncbi:MAG TPA: branched-chain amino acid ABC transporter permease, partial [Bacillota bacterium]|nr:branched-chain amino acid ABC transporter permease [Bacillota bacterium]HOG53668.1 branched-chain amino acid ABC transporter permease [Bacillota bacterium]